MVVTPKKALELNDFDRQQIAKLEKIIDEELTRRFVGEPLDIGLHIHAIDPRVYKAIQEKYNAAGWNVSLKEKSEKDYDQRDNCSYWVKNIYLSMEEKIK